MMDTEQTELKWFKAYGWWRCERCKKHYGERVMAEFDDCQYKPQFNFCPNCGRRVVKRTED